MENENLDDINIIGRFEMIFSIRNLIFVAKKKDIIRYYYYLIAKYPKIVFSSIKNYFEQLRQ